MSCSSTLSRFAKLGTVGRFMSREECQRLLKGLTSEISEAQPSSDLSVSINSALEALLHPLVQEFFSVEVRSIEFGPAVGAGLANELSAYVAAREASGREATRQGNRIMEAVANAALGEATAAFGGVKGILELGREAITSGYDRLVESSPNLSRALMGMTQASAAPGALYHAFSGIVAQADDAARGHFDVEVQAQKRILLESLKALHDALAGSGEDLT